MAKNKSSNKKERNWTKIIVKTIWGLTLFGFLSFTALMLFIAYSDLPSIDELENPKSLQASQVISSDNQVLGTYFLDNRVDANFHELSPHLINALIATEDERYYSHSGIDVRSLLRAVKGLGSDGGGSTISQQLAKMMFHEEAKSFSQRIRQKLGEWILAVRIEKRYTKEEIITMYFNWFDFTRNAVGINMAAKVYFNTTPDKLTIEQAAMLVGMAKSPVFYNPIGKPEKAKKRRNTVLYQMKRNDFISQIEFDSLKELPLETKYQKVDHKIGIAPYFREHLRQVLSSLLQEKKENGDYIYYNEKEGRHYDFYKDGLKIYTTIDARMQQHAEWAVEEHLSKNLQPKLDEFIKQKNGRYTKNPPFINDIDTKIAQTIFNRAKKQTPLYRKLTGVSCYDCGRTGTFEKTINDTVYFVCKTDEKHKFPKPTEKQIEEAFNTPVETTVFDWKSKNHEKKVKMSPMEEIKHNKQFLRSALMSIDPRNGHIKAWVGGPNFEHFQYDMVYNGKRQTGSIFKPFVYATAIELGKIKPCDEIPNITYCVDVDAGNGNFRSWCPDNAGGLPLEGQGVNFKYLLATSMNNGAARAIGLVKTVNVKQYAEKAGLPEGILGESPTMALGSYEFSVYDMVSALSTFVNKGIHVKPTIINRIEDKDGNVIYESSFEAEQVFNPQTAYAIIDMLKGAVDGVEHASRPGVKDGTSRRLRGNYPYGGLTNPIAGKTGTTNNNADGWFVGLTPELVTGVWTGGEDPGVRFSSTAYGQGANMALPIWGYYMNKVYKDNKIEISKGDFPKPDNFDDSFINCQVESFE